MVCATAELDDEYIVLTDHSPCLNVANGVSVERLRKQLVVIDTINDSVGKQIRPLKGTEADILDDGSLEAEAPENHHHLMRKPSSKHVPNTTWPLTSTLVLNDATRQMISSRWR